MAEYPPFDRQVTDKPVRRDAGDDFPMTMATPSRLEKHPGFVVVSEPVPMMGVSKPVPYNEPDLNRTRDPEITKQIAALHEDLTLFSKTISELADRLSPVLAKISDKDANAVLTVNVKDLVEGYSAPLSEEIATARARVRSGQIYVHSLINRLGV